jgi:protocatechuate 3,4-dioxygenase beta subunit
MRKGLILAAGLLCSGVAFAQQSGCGAPTPADQEGPFYKAGAPLRASLAEKGSKAEKLVLEGRVLSAACEPIAGATLDFWQADADGAYDNSGYRYRGIVRTDAEGRYRLETILPPPYLGRPRHIHVKVGRPGARVLTTQLYFPGESRGANSALVVKMVQRGGALRAGFDFVLK